MRDPDFVGIPVPILVGKYGLDILLHFVCKMSVSLTCNFIPMKRYGFKMKLKPGFREEYRKRHAAIWPELKKLIKDSGVSDYSIFLDKETNILFAFQKQSGGQSSQDLGSNPVVQKWWKYMADIMETNPDNSPVTIPLEEVFHMD